MTAVDVHLDNRQSDLDCDSEYLCALLAAVLGDQGVQPPAEVGLALVSVDEMTHLNETHMHHTGATGATDVLAFPLDGTVAQPNGQPTMVGDIVICPSVAARSAESLGDELALLTVHGALHLLGHDHYAPDEAAIMQSVQRDLLQRFHEQSTTRE